MKLLSVVGARPQFIKAAPFVRAVRASHHSILVHTGQHYDDNMSDVFFQELDLPAPDFDLGVGSGPHGAQTGAMLAALEQVLVTTEPDWVVVFGDTNSTLAGALAAAKLGIKVAHVEAGLRSFNRRMPEEINRVLADHLADTLFCPSETAQRNLEAEGRTRGVHVVGDVMKEAHAEAVERAQKTSAILERLALKERGYLLATVHRAENTDDPKRLDAIVRAFGLIDETIIFPVHPRTKNVFATRGTAMPANVRVVDPLGYLDIVRLQQSARLILTDSGGLQKEAYWSGVPCVTLRDETEWAETVEQGWNVLAGADTDAIANAVRHFTVPVTRAPLYDDVRPSARIVDLLTEQ
jgi:UDP-N-acetylglucosamine 2-epimerase